MRKKATVDDIPFLKSLLDDMKSKIGTGRVFMQYKDGNFVPLPENTIHFTQKDYDTALKEINGLIKNRKWEDLLSSYSSEINMLESLIEMNDYLTDKEFFKCLGVAYTISEVVHCHWEKLNAIMEKRESKFYKFLMDRKELNRYKKLPDELQIYRGCTQYNLSGFSWTLDMNVAMSFCERHDCELEPLIICGSCKKQDIYAYFDRREEQEIFINPNKVKFEKYLLRNDIKENDIPDYKGFLEDL